MDGVRVHIKTGVVHTGTSESLDIGIRPSVKR